MNDLDGYEQKLLKGWEEVYKKGQLTFWIMLSLKDGSKHMSAIKEFIADCTNGTITADDQSMYRALRRYHAADMLTFTLEPGEGGPERKVYELTPAGFRVLESFCQRNIVATFYRPTVQNLVTNKRGNEHERIV